jgi:hypothetical protein
MNCATMQNLAVPYCGAAVHGIEEIKELRNRFNAMGGGPAFKGVGKLFAMGQAN